jgi:L-alanine-DL-glutamate epimerase-like enolase superfamily enzyme
MSFYSAVADLPIEIDSYELAELDRTFPSGFTRPSTLITLRGGGLEGVGEDVVYDDLDHIALRDAGPVHDLTGPANLGELCELIGSLDLFPAPPVRDFSRLYRRWAFESAALDLALRQAGKPLHDVVGREIAPLNFVCSVRANPVAESGGDNDKVLAPIRNRIERYPGLRFKLDPQPDWDDEVIAYLLDSGAIDSLDLKGCYAGTPVDVEAGPDFYNRFALSFPDAWLEDPKMNDETIPVLEPHKDRITWDSPIHSVADIEALTWKPKIVNVKPSRIGGLEALSDAYAYCEREGIGAYGGGQTELSVGRDHIQYLAAMMHPTTPNDVAPRGYNETELPEGLPSSPLALVPEPVGFGLAESP